MKVLLIGLGRIGKLVARKIVAEDQTRLDWVGTVEQTIDPELLSYTLNHDSTYGALTKKLVIPKILLGSRVETMCHCSTISV